MSEPLDPIFVVDFSCFSFLSQPRRARSRDLIDFAGWHRHVSFPEDPALTTYPSSEYDGSFSGTSNILYQDTQISRHGVC